MSYVTRPIRGIQITFLTSVQPNDRLPRFVLEHSRLFRLRHRFASSYFRFVLISRSEADRATSLFSLRTIIIWHLRPLGLFFRELTDTLSPLKVFISVTSRIIPFHSQRFQRTSPLFSLHRVLFRRDFMVLASYYFITIGYSRHIISIQSVYLAHFLSFSCITTVSSHDHRVWRIKPFR